MQWAKQKGFTIVELLIVVVVIAILAAITIVAYTGIQNRTHDSAVQNDLSTLFKKLEAWKIDNTQGRYPTPASTADFAAIVADSKIAFKFSTNSYSTTVANNIAYCFASDGSEVGIVAMAKSGNAFYISTTTSGVKEYTPVWTSTAASTCRNADAALSVLKTSGYGNIWARTSQWNYGV
ncbi:hypothetical protein BGO17_00875 [Candidatus Saccharibacteria bacterium 49-20]|nr:MAG: hypothetical protein BGO17_00875 [Candidatus Saccharibacteria bacterium 49-20]